MNELVSLNKKLRSIIDRYRSIDGKVDYLSLTADNSMVEYAESLAGFDLGSLPTRADRLAFWINCYNSLSIYGVVTQLKKEPAFAEKGNRGCFGRVRFFAIRRFNVGGKLHTLRAIENRVRKEFNEPRIHFALNCSSLGCPILKDGLYSGQNIDSELDAAARLNLSSDEGFRLDEENGILSVSMIFKWYKKDFETGGKSTLEFIHKYAPQKARRYRDSTEGSIRIAYIPYDWSLNASKLI